jgi:hypothetical protein
MHTIEDVSALGVVDATALALVVLPAPRTVLPEKQRARRKNLSRR